MPCVYYKKKPTDARRQRDRHLGTDIYKRETATLGSLHSQSRKDYHLYYYEQKRQDYRLYCWESLRDGDFQFPIP